MTGGERYGETEYSVVKIYNDGMVQAVTFAYLIYWWVSCIRITEETSKPYYWGSRGLYVAWI